MHGQSSSKPSKQERTGAWPKTSRSHFCFLPPSHCFFLVGRQTKGGKSVLFLAARAWSSDPLVSCHQSPRNLTRFLTGISLRLKKHGMHIGSSFAQMPSRGISCDIAIQWSWSLPVRTRPHWWRRGLRSHLDVNFRRITYKLQCFSRDSGSWLGLPQHNYNVRNCLPWGQGCYEQKTKIPPGIIVTRNRKGDLLWTVQS